MHRTAVHVIVYGVVCRGVLCVVFVVVCGVVDGCIMCVVFRGVLYWVLCAVDYSLLYVLVYLLTSALERVFSFRGFS